jgi:hypothetical protein
VGGSAVPRPVTKCEREQLRLGRHWRVNTRLDILDRDHFLVSGVTFHWEPDAPLDLAPASIE